MFVFFLKKKFHTSDMRSNAQTWLNSSAGWGEHMDVLDVKLVYMHFFQFHSNSCRFGEDELFDELFWQLRFGTRPIGLMYDWETFSRSLNTEDACLTRKVKQSSCVWLHPSPFSPQKSETRIRRVQNLHSPQVIIVQGAIFGSIKTLRRVWHIRVNQWRQVPYLGFFFLMKYAGTTCCW